MERSDRPCKDCGLFKNIFYLFMTALGLHCYAQAFSGCSKLGLLFVALHGFSLWYLLFLRSPDSRQAGFSNWA